MHTKLLSAFCFACAACGSSTPRSSDEPRAVYIELSELEIHPDSIDRFAHCPPPGDLGRAWISARVTESPQEPAVTERAIGETLRPFRRCYRKGQLHRANEGGRAAVVLRLAPDGKIAAVENYASCELSREVLECMVHEAKQLKFAPPT